MASTALLGADPIRHAYLRVHLPRLRPSFRDARDGRSAARLPGMSEPVAREAVLRLRGVLQFIVGRLGRGWCMRHVRRSAWARRLQPEL